MPYLPSLLEYSKTDLENRLEIICKNLPHFLSFQKSPDDKIYLHLDFVLPQFAEVRNVKPGNSLEIVFELLEKYLQEKELFLSIHLMGEEADLDLAFDFLLDKLTSYNFEQENWSGIIFVQPQDVESFEPIVEYSNFKLGTWYDYNSQKSEIWDQKTTFISEQEYLLMSVTAGQSGQKLSEQTQKILYTIAEQNPESIFTFDGGWSLNSNLKDNLNIVSYSDFWQKFETSS